MKYLNSRDSFLNNDKIYEEAGFDMSGGPLGIDINWGDSLIGRLINSFTRKAIIGYNTYSILYFKCHYIDIWKMTKNNVR